jgi:hypothetical protein
MFWKILKLIFKVCYFVVENTHLSSKGDALVCNVIKKKIFEVSDFRYEGKPQTVIVDL